MTSYLEGGVTIFNVCVLLGNVSKFIADLQCTAPAHVAYMYYTVCHGYKVTGEDVEVESSRQGNPVMCRTKVGKAAMSREIEKRKAQGKLRSWEEVKHLTPTPEAERPAKTSPMFYVKKRGIPVEQEVREIHNLSAPEGLTLTLLLHL